MAQAAKFLFDRNFETPANDAEPPEVLRERELRRQFDIELHAAREAEYQRGLAEGREQAAQSREAGTQKAVTQLAASAKNILQKLDNECAAIRSEAVQIAVAAANCLAAELVRNQPTALLEALFSECLEHLSDAPHVAVRVHDSIAGQLQEKLNAAADAKGFTGRIIVLGDPETAKGDCRIEWADGGISRNFESLRLSISEIVARHLAAKGNHAGNGTAKPAAPASNSPPASEAARKQQTQTNGSGDHP